MDLNLPEPVSTSSNDNSVQGLVDMVLSSYQRYYNIQTDCHILGTNLTALARFHSRGEKYVMVKSAKLWAIECNEYVMVMVVPKFDEEQAREAFSLLERAEAEFVKPHSEHMYTHLSIIIIASHLHSDALKQVKRHKFRKNYRFTLHGWSNGRIAVINAQDMSCYANRDGKEIAKFLEKKFRAGSIR